MRHARDDYNRIQDPDGKIGEDEPVFLIRAQDRSSSHVVRFWAHMNDTHGGDPELSRLAREHADEMERWQATHTRKPADGPKNG